LPIEAPRKRWPRRATIIVRLAVGTWLALLGTIVLAAFGDWWGLLFYPFAALHYYLAYRRARRGA